MIKCGIWEYLSWIMDKESFQLSNLFKYLQCAVTLMVGYKYRHSPGSPLTRRRGWLAALSSMKKSNREYT
ncbi:hypothetical protein RO3G_16333 [Rhizopus delemar RA 99-880]|uniref:Uncharacterized protein n=1 Tax=Rhizopus delemar (strain RA 99-880 / ATCC MYA-4621 / FGSC 9543 / NRRL 43880) TaxID=246409 RepID=I1CT42_RHIO9|nr:hypothetical protein RO3G_16333 [Rhizopus delemar RA 99-880]|eukprot:EIE91622.1 hypothetical protein RO3G_16333 [Rhizopus delemar RA 99-880]